MGDDSYVIMWVLAGSSVHKTWPHLDEVLAKLMLNDKKVKVVLIGDDFCRLLEAGWEDEERVICRSGEWNIRETMAFAYECDMVMGS